jgi:hypothetical protein
MSRRFARVSLPILGILLLSASFAVASDEMLRLVPDSAWGLISINNPKDADAKINDLNREIQLPANDPLAAFKQVTGIQDGLDEESPAGYIFLPPETEGGIPIRIMLLPVTNYDALLSSLNAESKTDEVTQVQFSHAATVIRHVGRYAVLGGTEHRKAIEALKLANEPPASLKPWRQWISSHDVAAVVLQPGIRNLSVKGQTSLKAMRAMLSQAGEQGKRGAASLEMYEQLLQAVEKEASSFGLGLQLDKHNTLRVNTRLEPVPSGNWSKFIAKVPQAKENLLTGLPSGPFVMAGGGVLSDELMEGMLKLSLSAMKSVPDMFSYGLGEEQFGKLSEQLKTNFKGLRSMSMVLGVGKSDEPIYSNLLGVMRVENAELFLKAYDKYVEQFNEFAKGAKSPLVQPMKIEKSVVAGVPALQVTMKIAKPAGVSQMPQYDQMMEVMIGPGGKIVFWIASVDEHTLVMGYVNKKRVEDMVVALKRNEAGVANEADMLKTVSLLPPNAPMVAFLCPQGIVSLIKRGVATLLPPDMQEKVTIPDFPATPPLGIAVTSAHNELQTTLAVPVEVLKSIGQYVQSAKGASR